MLSVPEMLFDATAPEKVPVTVRFVVWIPFVASKYPPRFVLLFTIPSAVILNPAPDTLPESGKLDPPPAGAFVQ